MYYVLLDYWNCIQKIYEIFYLCLNKLVKMKFERTSQNLTKVLKQFPKEKKKKALKKVRQHQL